MPFPAYVGGCAGIALITLCLTWALRNRGTLPIAVAFVGAIALLLFGGLGSLNLVVDDSYISFRYAQHLADGQGPNWNSTGRVEGYTNFLWVLILAGFAKAHVSLVVTSRVLDCLAVVATLVVMYRIWRLWAAEDEEGILANPVLLAAGLALLALTGGVQFYAFAGMETALFMALITASAYFFFLERRGRSPPWSAVTLAAAAMTRPEGVLAAAVTGVFVLHSISARRDGRALRHAALWAALFFGLYGSYFIWRYSYYGYLLPNTFYAKVGANTSGYTRGLGYLREIGVQYSLLPMFIAAASLLPREKLRIDVAYVIALCGSFVAAIILEGGDFMPYGRFALPILPLIYLTGVAGFAVFLRRTCARPQQAALVGAIALSLTGLSLVQGSTPGLLPQERIAYHQHRAIADWIRQNTPANVTVGVFPAGVLSYYSDRDVLDMLGINDTAISHSKVARFGAGIVGHEKYNLDYVFEVRPEILVALEGQVGPATKEDILNANRDPTLLQPHDVLLADDRLWANYQLESLVIDGQWLNVFVRNDTVSQLRGPGLIDPKNLLAHGGSSSDGWQTWQSSIQASGDTLQVSSNQTAYGPYQQTGPIESAPLADQTYVSLAWVKGTATSVGDLISVSLRDNGQHGPATESNKFFLLSTNWQPIWVTRTVSSSNVSFFSMHIIKFNDTAKQDTLMVRDAQVRRILD